MRWAWVNHREWVGRVAAMPLFVVLAAFAAFGVDLFVQPERWDNTPSYANLLDIFDQQIWGSIYLAVAVVMVVSIAKPNIRTLAVVAHTMAAALILAWLLAFIIRWLNNSGTTIVNPVMWSVLLYLIVHSLLKLDNAPPSEGGPL